jgi:hypothetical protein
MFSVPAFAEKWHGCQSNLNLKIIDKISQVSSSNEKKEKIAL